MKQEHGIDVSYYLQLSLSKSCPRRWTPMYRLMTSINIPPHGHLTKNFYLRHEIHQKHNILLKLPKLKQHSILLKLPESKQHS